MRRSTVRTTLAVTFAAAALVGAFALEFPATAVEAVLTLAQRAGVVPEHPLIQLIARERYRRHVMDGHIRRLHPRIILPELSAWNGRGKPDLMRMREQRYAERGEAAPACGGGDLAGLAACWVSSGNAELGTRLLTKLSTYQPQLPRADGNVGSGWELALAFDLARLHPAFSATLTTQVQHRLAKYLERALYYLDRRRLSLWHSRSSLAAAAWLAAVMLDPESERDAELMRRAQAHFLASIDGLALTEAWPEGYNYWINSRAFLIALASSAYLNALDDAGRAADIRRIMRRVGTWHLYASRPDDTVEGFGDEGPRVDLKDETRRVVDILAQSTGAPELAAYSQYLGRLHGDESYYRDYRWGFRLFNDPTIAAGDEDRKLPLSALFGRDALNLAYMRGGWGRKDTFISFRAGHNLTHHGHSDAGHFTLFKGRPLAVNSSTYSTMRDPHRRNYAIRSIAKNTLLIQRPRERVTLERQFDVNVADGGQRVAMPFGSAILNVADWKRKLWGREKLVGGRIVAYEHRANDGATLITADLTDAYNTPRYDSGGHGGKVQSVTRTLYFSPREDRLYVFDQVVTVDPAFTPKWLLHSGERPGFGGLEVLKGSANDGILETDHCDFTIYNGDWSLHVDTVLPAPCAARVIGGHGHQYYVEVDGDDNELDGTKLRRWRKSCAVVRSRAVAHRAVTDDRGKRPCFSRRTDAGCRKPRALGRRAGALGCRRGNRGAGAKYCYDRGFERDFEHDSL